MGAWESGLRRVIPFTRDLIASTATTASATHTPTTRTWLFDDLKKIELDGKTYAHDLIMDQAVKWISLRHKRPFFCFLPVTIPHAAMHVPEKYAAPFRKKFPEFEDKIGKYGNNAPFAKNPAAQFAGMMTALDEGVGRILDTLKELELDEDTIVFLSSDNGPHKEGGHMPDYFNSNGSFRGYKRDLYEGGIRCPLLVRWPGKIKPGSTSDHLSAHWDVLPTFCELAETKAPVIIDGISFVPTLLGKRQQAHKYLYWEFFEGGGKRAMRMGNWKAVQNNLNKGGPNAPIELYDLSKDSAERNNLAAKNPEIVYHAKHIFEEAHTPSQILEIQMGTVVPAIPTELMAQSEVDRNGTSSVAIPENNPEPARAPDAKPPNEDSNQEQPSPPLQPCARIRGAGDPGRGPEIRRCRERHPTRRPLHRRASHPP